MPSSPNSQSPRLRALARRINQHAQISTRPGQLEDLESIAAELHGLAEEVSRLHAVTARARYWTTRRTVVADGRTVALDILDQAPR